MDNPVNYAILYGLKSLYIIIRKSLKRVQEVGPYFHRLHITENTVGVPKMFHLKINL